MYRTFTIRRVLLNCQTIYFICVYLICIVDEYDLSLALLEISVAHIKFILYFFFFGIKETAKEKEKEPNKQRIKEG